MIEKQLESPGYLRSLEIKGGSGSGSWEGPGNPRFARGEVEGKVSSILKEVKEAKKYGFDTFSAYGRERFGMTKDQQSNIYDYVMRDKEPVGKRKKTLDLLASKAKGSTDPIIVYRGLRCNKDMIQGIEKSLKSGKIPTIQLNRPSSWTNSSKVAYNFSKPGGPRSEYGKEGILLKILAPKGTKAVRLDIAFGVGAETLLPTGAKFCIVKVEKFRSVYRFIGKLV